MAVGRKVSFPAFDAEARETIAATLNDYVVVDNPLDYHTFIWNQRDKLAATFSAVMKGQVRCGHGDPRHPRQSRAWMRPPGW